MNHYQLLRSYLKDRTVGQLQHGDFALDTLERPWLNNQVDVSCYPEGTYIVRRDTAGRFQYYRVENVPMRSNIEFHKGVIPENSNGCTLLDAPRLLAYQGDESFLMTVRQFNVYTDKWL